MNVVWFRNDLRLADNAALTQALKSKKPTMGLFVLNPQQHQIHGESPQKLEFIKAHVKDLRKRLDKLAVPLWYEEQPTFADTADTFLSLFEKFPVTAVYCHESHWVNELKRDQQVFKLLADKGVSIHTYSSNYLLKPGTVRKDDGSMYHVFTPYKNKYITQLKAAYQLPLPTPKPSEAKRIQSQAAEFKTDIRHDFSQELSSIWPIGEVAVNQRLQGFVAHNDYQAKRDFPAINGTSSLSPYLAIGVISAQQCLAHMLKQHGEDAFYSTWVSELIWRDFYNDLMYEYPKLAKHQTFKPDAVDDWRSEDKLFEKWQQGQTGFPIVDAGMRQLSAEGWMHNRVRMIVASFLTKLCLIDWRRGEAHFMAQLLDGDLASNNGGWQWSSATGCDAAPYFRIFNPTTQSKKFDPDGLYIKRYVSELAALDGKEIHDPKPASREACDYPQPVIDYKAARQQALDWFKK